MNATSINELSALNIEFLMTARKINGDGSSTVYYRKLLKKGIVAMDNQEKPAYISIRFIFLI